MLVFGFCLGYVCELFYEPDARYEVKDVLFKLLHTEYDEKEGLVLFSTFFMLSVISSNNYVYIIQRAENVCLFGFLKFSFLGI